MEPRGENAHPRVLGLAAIIMPKTLSRAVDCIGEPNNLDNLLKNRLKLPLFALIIRYSIVLIYVSIFVKENVWLNI